MKKRLIRQQVDRRTGKDLGGKVHAFMGQSAFAAGDNLPGMPGYAGRPADGLNLRGRRQPADISDIGAARCEAGR